MGRRLATTGTIPFDPGAFSSAQDALAFISVIVESSTACSLVAVDADELVVLWNEGAHRLYGYERSEILGKSWSTLYSPEDVAHGLPAEMMRGALNEGKWESSLRLMRKDRSPFMASAVVTPWSDTRGQFRGFLSITIDLTDRLPPPVPPTLTITQTPPAISTATCGSVEWATEGEVTGLSATLNRSPITVQGDSSCFHDLAVGPYTFEITAVGPGGSASASVSWMIVAEKPSRERELEAARARSLVESAPDAIVIVDRAGEIRLVNAGVEELCGYAPEELLGHPVDLLIAPRSRHLHAERSGFLAAARSYSRGADLDLWARCKDGVEFPVEVSLRPLPAEDCLLTIAAIRATRRRRLVRDPPEPVDAQELLAHVAAAVRPRADGKSLVLSVHTPARPTKVRTDRRALRQILIALANNAIELAGDGGIRLDVVRDHARARTVFRVADTGCSVGTDERSRSFAASEHADASAGSSTRNGLHGAQTLASALGAEIEFESGFGPGSLFRLELPD